VGVQAGIAVATLLLQAYFAYVEQQGKTKEEAEKLYQEISALFYANKPADLPDPV
jgi:hypothetical protein